MSKLIQKAGFLNTKRAGRYMNYIATRDGVELLDKNADSIYMRYIATRPRAEKHGEHGLFGAPRTLLIWKRRRRNFKRMRVTSGRSFIRSAERMLRVSATITPQAGGHFCALSRQISQKPCRFLRRSFGGMQLSTTRANIRIYT